MLPFQYIYVHIQKTKLTENGNCRLFATNWEKNPANFCLLSSANRKRKMEVGFPWSENDKTVINVCPSVDSRLAMPLLLTIQTYWILAT
jgi:hypothetical protein